MYMYLINYVYVEILEATNKALNSLRKGAKGKGGEKRHLKDEIASIFSEKPMKCARQHHFVYLTLCDQTRIPTLETEKGQFTSSWVRGKRC